MKYEIGGLVSGALVGVECCGVAAVVWRRLCSGGGVMVWRCQRLQFGDMVVVMGCIGDAGFEEGDYRKYVYGVCERESSF